MSLNEMKIDIDGWGVFGVPICVDTNEPIAGGGGPEAIRGAVPYFDNVSTGKIRELWDWNTGRILDVNAVAPSDLGNITIDEPEKNFSAVIAAIEFISGRICAAGGRPLALGGEHWLSLPSIMGVLTVHREINVVHFDAHSDRYIHDSSRGRSLTNGNVMSHVDNLKGVRTLLQVGIREFDVMQRGSVEHLVQLKNAKVVSMDNCTTDDPENIFSYLDADCPIYITIDADVLDPAYAPEVGWPVIGGLSVRELRKMVSYLSRTYRIVGMDLVEVVGTSKMNTAAMALARCALDVIMRSLFSVRIFSPGN